MVVMDHEVNMSATDKTVHDARLFTNVNVSGNVMSQWKEKLFMRAVLWQ